MWRTCLIDEKVTSLCWYVWVELLDAKWWWRQLFLISPSCLGNFVHMQKWAFTISITGSKNEFSCMGLQHVNILLFLLQVSGTFCTYSALHRFGDPQHTFVWCNARSWQETRKVTQRPNPNLSCCCFCDTKQPTIPCNINKSWPRFGYCIEVAWWIKRN